jgi:hypothetical protein
MGLNTRYLVSGHGAIKIIEIIVGFFICALLCANWYPSSLSGYAHDSGTEVGAASARDVSAM